MHADKSAQLFEGHGRLPLTAQTRTFILALCLILNSLTVNPHFHIIFFGLSLFISFLDRTLIRRLKTLGLGFSLALIFFISMLWTGSSPAAALSLGLRTLNGLSWTLWFGASVTWLQFKQVLRILSLPEFIIDLLESSISCGHILLIEMSRRYDAAQIRLGFKFSPLTSTARVISGGIEQALSRGFEFENTRALEQAPPLKIMHERKDKVIELKQANISYSSHTVICGINFSLNKNQWIALAGPSGSGKSTFLKAMSGLLPLQAQKFERLGSFVDGKASLTKRIDGNVGLIFQNPDDQIFGSTPMDDLIWGLMQRGHSQALAHQKSLSLLKELELDHLKDRPIYQLSFGEKKRIIFASTLVCEPEILLCDEPTIGLDPVAASKIVRWLEEYAQKKTMSVIWATHDLEHLPKSIERICILSGGHLVFDGAISDGLTRQKLIQTGLAIDESQSYKN